jgi:hypothetical protein
LNTTSTAARLAAIFIGVAVLSLVGYFAISAGAAGRSAPTELDLLDVSGAGVPVGDASKHPNPHPGDQVLLTDALYRWDGAHRGARVGHVYATLSFRSGFSKTGAKVSIVGQLFLPSGSLLVEGFTTLSNGAAGFTLPVIGGTGVYAGSRGTLTTHDIGSNGSKSTMIVRLIGA